MLEICHMVYSEAGFLSDAKIISATDVKDILSAYENLKLLVCKQNTEHHCRLFFSQIHNTITTTSMKLHYQVSDSITESSVTSLLLRKVVMF